METPPSEVVGRGGGGGGGGTAWVSLTLCISRSSEEHERNCCNGRNGYLHFENQFVVCLVIRNLYSYIYILLETYFLWIHTDILQEEG